MSVGPIGSNLFSGIAVLTPYYHLWTEKLYDYRNKLALLDKVKPHHIFRTEYKPRDEEFMAKWGDYERDSTIVWMFTARCGVLWIEEQEVAEKAIIETDVPFLFIEASRDGVVRNDYIQAMYEKAKKAGKKNEYVTVHGKDSDHSLVTVDPVHGSFVMKNVIRYFDKLIKEKETKN